METNVKLPPHDLDAEEATLGSFLIDPDAIKEVSFWLTPEMFYREKNRWVYSACLALLKKSEPADPILVAHELSTRQQLEAMGGADYLSHLVNIVPTSVHIEYFARIVEKLSLSRKLITAGSQIANLGYETQLSADEALQQADDILKAVHGNHGKTAKYSLGLDKVSHE